MMQKKSKCSRRKKTTKPNLNLEQSELFELEEKKEIEVVLRVPAGTQVTLGQPPTSCPAQTKTQLSGADLMKALGSLSKEELRSAALQAKLGVGAIVKISTTMHALLYTLAGVGGKVSGRT